MGWTCPYCGKPMESKKITKQECLVLDWIDGDSEYYTVDGKQFSCKPCKIKYNDIEKEWKIPKNVEKTVTEKQEKCIGIICKNLQIPEYPAITKLAASIFIKENMEASKRASENYKADTMRIYDADDWDEEFWGEEHF